MAATVLMLAFRALLRAAGVLSVPFKGVSWVVGLDEFLDPPVIPRRHSGALLLVPARKTKQHQPSWVPINNKRATRLLAKHIRWRRRHARKNRFLFPSHKVRFRGLERAWIPNPRNRMSTKSLLGLMRSALVEVCGLSVTQAAKFTMHSLRVGGINYLRQAGVEIGMRARAATHKSVITTRIYNRMIPIEGSGKNMHVLMQNVFFFIFRPDVP